MTKLSKEQTLKQSQLALDNSQSNVELATTLKIFGYDPPHLHEGVVLRETAQTLMLRQYALHGNFFKAQDAYKEEWQRAREIVAAHFKIAQVAFKHDRGARQKLGLMAARKINLAGWIAQAYTFYDAALADTDILDRLAAFGIISATLELGRQQVAALHAHDATRQQLKSATRDMSHQRDLAFAALEVWMRDFVKVARVALRGRPQLLSQLGLAPYSKRHRHAAAAAGSDAEQAPTARKAAPNSKRHGRATAAADSDAEHAPPAHEEAPTVPDTPASGQPPISSNGHAVLSDHPM